MSSCLLSESFEFVFAGFECMIPPPTRHRVIPAAAFLYVVVYCILLARSRLLFTTPFDDSYDQRRPKDV